MDDILLVVPFLSHLDAENHRYNIIFSKPNYLKTFFGSNHFKFDNVAHYDPQYFYISNLLFTLCFSSLFKQKNQEIFVIFLKRDQNGRFGLEYITQLAV